MECLDHMPVWRNECYLSNANKVEYINRLYGIIPPDPRSPAAPSDCEKGFLSLPDVLLDSKLKKERIAFHEISQTPVSRAPDAGGTFRRRMGTNLNPTGYNYEEETSSSHGTGPTGSIECRRSGVERRPGRPAAANPATFPATAADTAELAAGAGRRRQRCQQGRRCSGSDEPAAANRRCAAKRRGRPQDNHQ